MVARAAVSYAGRSGSGADAEADAGELVLEALAELVGEVEDQAGLTDGVQGEAALGVSSVWWRRRTGSQPACTSSHQRAATVRHRRPTVPLRGPSVGTAPHASQPPRSTKAASARSSDRRRRSPGGEHLGPACRGMRQSALPQQWMPVITNGSTDASAGHEVDHLVDGDREVGERAGQAGLVEEQDHLRAGRARAGEGDELAGPAGDSRARDRGERGLHLLPREGAPDGDGPRQLHLDRTGASGDGGENARVPAYGAPSSRSSASGASGSSAAWSTRTDPSSSTDTPRMPQTPSATMPCRGSNDGSDGAAGSSAVRSSTKATASAGSRCGSSRSP